MLSETQKVTVSLPKVLLHSAQMVTGLGITETLKESLEQLTRAKAYENLIKARGKYADSFTHVDLNELRKDRDEK
jgi:hypothetical protein